MNSGATLPPRADEPRIAAESDDDFGGFFIGLSIAVPAGLIVYAAVIAVLIYWQ
jgi:hypothetical protein